MPVSKDRRKAGGKATRQREIQMTPDEAFEGAFEKGYTYSFIFKHGWRSGLLDLIGVKALDVSGRTLRPVSRVDVLREFDAAECGGALKEDDPEKALAFLQADGWVEVAGDEIRVPARFRPDPAAWANVVVPRKHQE